jgi:helicase
MHIDDLQLPDNFIQYYKDKGLKSLYDPQAECVERGLMNGKNIVAAIPTASGKTFIAELAMVSSIIKGGKAIYVVPLKALASEKEQQFSELEAMGLSVGMSTGDTASKSTWLSKKDIIITTSEKTDSLVRNKAEWLNDITTVVLDEVHLLGDPGRGPTLEMVITLLRKINPNIQIVALSATVGNASEIADWMNAELVYSTWRPTELHEGVYHDGCIQFASDPDNQIKVIGPKSKPLEALAQDTVINGDQCLIFVNSRKSSKSQARNISKRISKHLEFMDKHELEKISAEILKTGDTETTKDLAEYVKGGTAFHNAGLNSKIRKIIEDGFKNNYIKVITCTPTLAAGINLPAKRVIIGSYYRYAGQAGSVPIPTLEYKQMAGRAGRPQFDKHGEAITVTKEYTNVMDVMSMYINGQAENIDSGLSRESVLRTYVLSLISTGFAHDLDTMIDIFKQTFMLYKTDQDYIRDIQDVIRRCMDFLLDENFVDVKDDKFYATRLGKIMSRLYVDPYSASVLKRGLLNIDKMQDHTLLEVICNTESIRSRWTKSNEQPMIMGYISTHAHEYPFSTFYQMNDDFYQSRFIDDTKTAMILNEWANEINPQSICSKFGIEEGDIHNYVENSDWMLYALSVMSTLVQRNHYNDIENMRMRVKYGVKEELLPLVSIRNIGRVRARGLYNIGIRNTSDIISAPREQITSILGEKTTDKVLEEINLSSDNQKPSDPQSTLETFKSH